MPRPEKYVPKHRNAPHQPALKKGFRRITMRALVLSGVAVAAIGIAVSSGIAVKGDSVDAAAAALTSATSSISANTSDTRSSDRGNEGSRSDRRTSLHRVKEKSLDQASGGQVTKTEDLSSQDPRDIARAMLPEFGFSDTEFGCLDSLYTSESGWNPHADNPSSSAYGIPQALTETHTMPAGYMTNPVTQIRWGLDYIRSSYGTPCSAWNFKQSNNWY